MNSVVLCLAYVLLHAFFCCKFLLSYDDATTSSRQPWPSMSNNSTGTAAVA